MNIGKLDIGKKREEDAAVAVFQTTTMSASTSNKTVNAHE
jgi:hypothetical protein